MKTDELFADKLEKLQRELTSSLISMRKLNEQASNLCVTLKAAAKETRLKVLLNTLTEQEREAGYLALGTGSVAKSLEEIEKEIGKMI